MNICTYILALALSALPAAQQVAEARPPDQIRSDAIDFEAAIEVAAMHIVAEDLGAELVWIQERDPDTGQFVAGETDEENGYWSMLYSNSYDPAVLMFFAASVAEMYSGSDLRTQCAESTIVTCSDPFPGTTQQDALITAGVYAGVTALQRLAETQWDVDMDEGWKNLLIFGAMATVRGLIAGQNMSDANALRDLGR